MDPFSLYPPQSPDDRAALLQQLNEIPFGYGTWNRFKQFYKRLEGEPDSDPQLLGAAIGRIDNTALSQIATIASLKLGRVESVAWISAEGGRLAVLANRSYREQEIRIVHLDSANPLTPALGKTEKVHRHAERVVLMGDCLALLQRQATLSLYDVSDPTQPPLLRGANLQLGGNNWIDAQAVGGRLVTLTNPSGQPPLLTVVAIYPIASPAVLGTLPLPGASHLIPLGDDRHVAALCQATGFRWGQLPSAGTLQIVDLERPDRPRVVAKLEMDGAQSATRDGSQLVVLCHGTQNRLVRVDIADPQRPRTVGSVPASLPFGELIAHRGTLYQIQAYGSLAILRTDLSPVTARSFSTVRIGQYGGAAIVDERLYVTQGFHGVGVWDLAHPEQPHAIGAPPRPETFGYLKRRARRCLRGLARTDPDRFVAVAAAALEGLDSPQLNPARHWVACDLLFGGGRRYVQGSHGRGALREATPVRFSYRRREERAPSAWDAHPELAAALYQSDRLPAPVLELGLRALRAAGHPVPALSAASLSHHLTLNSPLLSVFAARAAAARPSLSAQDAARAFLRASPPVRRALEPRIVHFAADPKWGERFAQAAIKAIGDAGGERLNRRQIALARLVAVHLPAFVSGDDLERLAPALLATGEEPLIALVEIAARGAALDEPGDWLEIVASIADPQVQERLMRALEEAVRTQEIDEYEIYVLVEDENPLVRAALWRLLAASQLDIDVLHEVFVETLFEIDELTDAAVTILSSPYALALLERAGIDGAELSALMGNKPFLVAALTPAAFADLARTVPIETLLRLIAAAPDDHWSLLRPGWIALLEDGADLRALWAALPGALRETGDTRLAARLLDDPQVGEALLALDDVEAALDVRLPELGPLLGRLLDRFASRLETDEALRIGAATHPLPEARSRGLAAVSRHPLNLASALRLLECELPDAMAAGLAWFDAPADPDQRLRRVLGLCDSPVPSVRRLGAQRARGGDLPLESLCAALYENADPHLQALALELLGQAPADDAASQFEGEVLRVAGRGRKAKELVKKRQESAASVDTKTLLALARSAATPRDAQWALSQLTRRALAGEEIEGLEILR